MTNTNESFNRLFQSRPTKLIAVVSGKGGVGRSTIAINLAIALAAMNKKVLLMDTDLCLPSLDILLDISCKLNLAHLLKGDCQINDIIVPGPGNISLILGSADIEYMSSLTLQQYKGILDAFNQVRTDWDYCFMDTACGLNDLSLNFARAAQEIILVLTEEPSSLTGAYSLIKLMSRRYQIQQFHILVNKMMGSQEPLDLFHKLQTVSDQFLSCNLNFLGKIPWDERLLQAQTKQEALLIAYPESLAAEGFLKIAQKIEALPVHLEIGANDCSFIEKLAAH